MILEGDFISPELCKKILNDARIKDRVKCVFMTEDDKSQIVQNYLVREGSIQNDRSELSLRYNHWLKAQAENTEIMTIASTPWETTLERVQLKLNE